MEKTINEKQRHGLAKTSYDPLWAAQEKHGNELARRGTEPPRNRIDLKGKGRDVIRSGEAVFSIVVELH